MAGSLANNHDAMREIFAHGQPVLVLGPGCQRIGYDSPDNPGWEEVTRRMRLLHGVLPAPPRSFLEALWKSKLSEETQERLADGASGYRIDADTSIPADGLVDEVRLALAVPLLGALIACTRCLGEVITRGKTPVISWELLTHDLPVDERFDESHKARDEAASNLSDFVVLASALSQWREGSLDDANAHELHGLGLTPGRHGFGSPEDEESLGAALDVLNIGGVATNSREFLEKCLGTVGVGETAYPLSGAMIEWLADLFWHVIVCDAGVPPSQSELAFYVNLRQRSGGRARLFTRARPGEHRMTRAELVESRDRSPDVTWPVRLRLQHGPTGVEPADDLTFPGDARLAFARTMAATLAAQWDRYRARPFAEMLPVALVAGYDLMLERQLLELSDAGDVFHVVVPVWVHRGRPAPQLDWLLGTYTRDQADVEERHLVSHERGDWLTWDWYHAEGDDRRDLRGPVVVRVNGSPLVDIGRRPTSEDLGLDSRPKSSEEELELATIFSEFDSVAAIITFSNEGAGLPGNLFRNLQWERRSWMFLGDSFPDWIPRLRLLYNARSMLTTASDGVGRRMAGAKITTKVAVDRAFDWPEESMLAALSVDTYTGDLSWLANYPKKRFDPDDATREFLEQVNARMVRAAGQMEAPAG